MSSLDNSLRRRVTGIGLKPLTTESIEKKFRLPETIALFGTTAMRRIYDGAATIRNVDPELRDFYREVHAILLEKALALYWGRTKNPGAEGSFEETLFSVVDNKLQVDQQVLIANAPRQKKLEVPGAFPIVTGYCGSKQRTYPRVLGSFSDLLKNLHDRVKETHASQDDTRALVRLIETFFRMQLILPINGELNPIMAKAYPISMLSTEVLPPHKSYQNKKD